MCNKLMKAAQSASLLLLLCCVSNGAAIKCFVCDSTDNPSCADLKSNSSIVPEECALDKMKSLDTWLFDLNKLSYFDNGANKNPIMNCQKVVARDPNNKLVTARFCQLDTGDSDACDILRSKLRITSDGSQQQRQRNGQQRNGGYGMDNSNAQETGAEGSDEEKEKEFFCDICKTDRCNGAAAVTLPLLLLTLILLIPLSMTRC